MAKTVHDEVTKFDAKQTRKTDDIGNEMHREIAKIHNSLKEIEKKEKERELEKLAEKNLKKK